MRLPPKTISALVALMLGVLGSVSGCASLPAADTTRAGHATYECAQAGNRGPVVVFEAGAGDSLTTWDPVFNDTAKFATAFAYSRRGEGRSSPVIAGRDGAAVVAQLRELLARRGLRPPYVLVGHSLGGLYVQLFAKLHPQEVAGIVLVDSTTAGWSERLKRELPGNYAMLQTVMVLKAATPLGAELRGEAKTSQQWREAGPLPPVPAIVLTSTKAGALDGPKLSALSQRAQRELVASWPGAEQRLVDGGHYLQRDRPAEVVAAIREVTNRVQRAR